jgi:hypothetical protein
MNFGMILDQANEHIAQFRCKEPVVEQSPAYFSYVNNFFKRFGLSGIYNAKTATWQIRDYKNKYIPNGSILRASEGRLERLCRLPLVQYKERAPAGGDCAYEMQDGTMITIFCSQGEWKISTRGGLCIDETEWRSRSYSSVLKECFAEQKVELEKLDASRSYGLIVQHPDWQPLALKPDCWFVFEYDPKTDRLKYDEFPTGKAQVLATATTECKLGTISRSGDVLSLTEKPLYKHYKFLFYDSKLFQDSESFGMSLAKYIKTLNAVIPERFEVLREVDPATPRYDQQITQIAEKIINRDFADCKIAKLLDSQIPVDAPRTIAFITNLVCQPKYLGWWAEYLGF